MKKHILFSITFLLVVIVKVSAQDGYNDKVRKYISQYYPLAVDEQKTSGIPACITLAQGVLETQAGESELMTGANNHFGIKCANGWQGETFNHDDDEKDECFKKYKTAAESYKDHSEHLKRNPRYAPLFSLSLTDYAAWCVCLKKCGYATNPQYAQQLIRIIEDFKLQDYTYIALDNPTLSKYAQNTLPVSTAVTTTAVANSTDNSSLKNNVAVTSPAPTEQHATVRTAIAVENNQATENSTENDISSNIDSSKIVEKNGMKAVYVTKGEMLFPYAAKYHIRYPRLLEMNDLPDGPAPFDMYLYLEKKLTYGVNATHTVADGETALMISQAEGLQLKKLLSLNLLNPNEEPVTGTVLELQKPSLKKPDVLIVETIAHKENAIVTTGTADPRPAGDFVTIKKPKTTIAAVAATKTDANPHTANTAPVTKNVPVVNPVVAAKETIIKNEITPKPLKAEMQEEQEDTTDEEDLASLKADLDKVVYADDSKLPKSADNTPNTQKNQAAALSKTSGARYYTIKKGETATGIARKNNITVKQLLEWNDMDASDIKAGYNIRVTDPALEKGIPIAKTKPIEKTATHSSGNEDYHVIQKGETLTSIAAKNHVTVKQLVEWNDIKANNIKNGQKLRVTGPADDNEADSEPASGKYHVIQKGETLTAIAMKNHISIKQLLKWNDIDANKVRDGQKLRVRE